MMKRSSSPTYGLFVYLLTLQMKHNPVLFIHGNSDSALEIEGSQWTSGWNRQIALFTAKGYSMGELYGLTYGDRNISTSFTR